MDKQIFKKLKEKFSTKDIEWRIGQSFLKDKKVSSATALVYVTNRAIQERLDDACGPDGWRNEFQPWKDGQLCGISIYDDEKGEWITKWDGAEDTKQQALKGGLSDSMKRAAVQWGIGRYLYKLPAKWVNVSDTKQNGWNYAVHKQKNGNKIEKIRFWWQTPSLPKWALPDGEADKATEIVPEPETYDYKAELRNLDNEEGTEGAAAGHVCEICNDQTTQELAEQTKKFYGMKMCDPCAQAAKKYYSKRKFIGVEEVAKIKKDRDLK